MTRQSDSEYFRRRLDQERARAERAIDPIARRVHDELADRYAAMVVPVAL